MSGPHRYSRLGRPFRNTWWAAFHKAGVRVFLLAGAISLWGCAAGGAAQDQGPTRGGGLPTLGLLPPASTSGAGGGNPGGGNPGGGAAPVLLGPQLTAPGNTFTCQDGYPIQTNATFPQPFYLTGAQSCLLLAFFPGAQPPGQVLWSRPTSPSAQ